MCSQTAFASNRAHRGPLPRGPQPTRPSLTYEVFVNFQEGITRRLNGLTNRANTLQSELNAVRAPLRLDMPDNVMVQLATVRRYINIIQSRLSESDARIGRTEVTVDENAQLLQRRQQASRRPSASCVETSAALAQLTETVEREQGDIAALNEAIKTLEGAIEKAQAEFESWKKSRTEVTDRQGERIGIVERKLAAHVELTEERNRHSVNAVADLHNCLDVTMITPINREIEYISNNVATQGDM